ncbi:hypothetical protein C8A00DRAFT_37815 [Chaetomidium leptoderma]|uniref:Uncharacterized protein n=1 Tax=Chaetomidium leptoderma TaxID=669021 RepID=A0AAN6VDS0_9PEZI|nr:hypothetical protein C8A00DRAFT_37815 [Chaetomidium leptoderma]
MEWTKDQYNKQYNNWVPWLEDLYLRYFTRDNKASYTARENLNKTKVTSITQVNTLQDGVNDLVAGQVGQDGLARPLGDLASREGMNRVERQGRDEQGGYVPATSSTSEVPVVGNAGDAVAGGVVAGGQQAAGAVKGGLLGFGKGKGEGRE